ncbi:NlpC/P60 family protein [Clostridium coskatii]|uniref:Murein DD-endopeptidase MepH n=1 Tax=Clostridium coskatii TaxID=1705578 RepID=A0A168N443_9CLOT|nr:C40 family peptidase [Clostridium coskatii]OAA85739.1 Murein DD-endopeptidase MepH precursor [Clostridium coskatii]OBR91440.1 murein DD-endopeptidase MepH precursor [Clostridium coskatii]
MNKRTLSVAIALTLALSTGANVLAAPGASSSSTSLEQVKQQKQELEVKAEKMDNQVIQTMNDLENNKKSIASVSNSIKQTQANIDSVQASIESQQKVFNQRAKAMYTNNMSGYLGAILNANNLNDFISRVDNVGKVMSFDKNVVGNLKSKKEQLANGKEKLNNENNKLLALKSENEKKLAKLNSDKESAKNVIASLDAQEKSLEITDQATLKAIASAASNVSASRGGTIISSDAVVAYASNFLGVPYVYGGTSPSGFDCSGLVQYVYANFGINLPRTSEEQQNVGTPVSRDELKPGDLVFFGSPAYHVGMYVGDGQFIEAPRTGLSVRIAALDNRSDFTGGRRVK